MINKILGIVNFFKISESIKGLFLSLKIGIRPFQVWRAITHARHGRRHNEIWGAIIARHKFRYHTSKK